MRNFLGLALTLLITMAFAEMVLAQNSNAQSNNTNSSANTNSKVTNANKSANDNKGANTHASTGSHANTKVSTQGAANQKIIDINYASRQDLISLPGIGEVYADKIIQGRPYKMKTDLVKRGIISQALYNSISAKIIAHHLKTTP